MRIATINVSIKDKTFHSVFPIDERVQEYEIADEAYRLGMMFADTQVIATYGHRISSSEYALFLRDLEYNYEIKEVQ